MLPINLCLRVIAVVACWFACLHIWAASQLDPCARLGFRGSDRNGIVQGEVGLLKSWPATGPNLKWKHDLLAAGYSSLVARDGVLYGQDSRRLLAMDAVTGRVIWKRGLGGSASTPALGTDGLFVLSGPWVVCLDTANGKQRWKIDVRSHCPDDIGRLGSWNQSVLIANGHVVLVTGSAKVPVLALRCSDGSLAWAASGLRPGPKGRSHSSPVLVDHNGRSLIIAQLRWTVVGLDADTGQVLWQHTVDAGKGMRTENHNLCNVPAYSNGILVIGGGYSKPTKAFRLSEDGTVISEIWSSRGMSAFQESYVIVDGMLFGRGVPTYGQVQAHPNFLLNGRPFGELKDGFLEGASSSAKLVPRSDNKGYQPYSRNTGLMCLDLQNGTLLGHNSGIKRLLGFSGPNIIHADGMFYLHQGGNDGTIYLVEDTPALKLCGQFCPPVPDGARKRDKHGKVAWTSATYSHPLIYRGMLYVKTAGWMFAYDIKDPMHAGAPP